MNEERERLEREFAEEYPDGFALNSDLIDAMKRFRLYCGSCNHGNGCQHGVPSVQEENIFVAFLRSDMAEAIQIREWLRVHRPDLRIEDVININISLSLKVSYPHLDLPDTNIGAALLIFAVNESASISEIVYIPNLGIYTLGIEHV